MNKVAVINSSIRTLRYGLLSLLPLVGVLFLVLAFSNRHRAHAEAGDAWNPAKRHLIAGSILAALGTLVLIATLVFAAFVYIQSKSD